MDRDQILALERPHRRLWHLYVIRSILAGPAIFVVLPVLLFRYHTLRYSFDDQGIHMRWGMFFRREVNLTYARIQDIHVRSGFIQRWLGLADLLVQTASGSAGPEMTIEGFREFEQIRDFLYTRMRGSADLEPTQKSKASDLPLPPGMASAGSGAELMALLGAIRDELRATRLEIQQRRQGP